MKNWFALLCALPLVAVAAPERIVALGGDVTEIVYALGAESSLVARDSTSQWPQATNALPDVVSSPAECGGDFIRTPDAGAGKRPGAALSGAETG